MYSDREPAAPTEPARPDRASASRWWTRSTWFCFTGCALLWGAIAAASGETPEPEAASTLAGGGRGLWTSHVEPLLQKNCMRCHGGAMQKSGLDLRSPAAILRGGKRGAAVSPGKPHESLILQVVQPGAELHMPPDDLGQLSAQDILILRRWISGDAAATGGWTIGSDAVSGVAKAAPETAQAAAAAWLPPAGVTPSLAIDLLLEARWRELGVEPTRRADDRTFVRRVYLDLAGRIPARAEVEAFLNDNASDKRERLLDALLDAPGYARRMREVFDVVLMGRGDARTTQRRRSGKWYDYLEWSFRTDRPWIDIVRDLLVARPSESEEEGSVWFLYEGRDKHQAIAERLAPAVFGLRVECAQCHDHPVAPEIEQRHYWGLVSFLSRSRNLDTARGPGVGESAVGGFSKFADLQGENHDAVLAFFDGAVVPETRPADHAKEVDAPEKYIIPPTPKGERTQRAPVPKFSRREQLFRLAAETDLLARSFVNRVWALLMGRGLVHPVDKMDSAHPPSHPRLLHWLSRDFQQSGYDIKRLVRNIARSRAYQLDSRVAEGTPPLQPDTFAYALDKPLAAEVLYRSLLVATGRGAVAAGEAALDGPGASRFAELFPDLFPEENVSSLGQALFLSNSPLLDELLAPVEGSTTAAILAVEEPEEQVVAAFDATLGRPPDEAEVERGIAFVKAHGERRVTAVKGLLWALVTSAEFRMNR